MELAHTSRPASLHSGVVVKLLIDSVVHLNVGGSNPLLRNISSIDVIFITLCSCMVYCITFYYQEMACIYPPSQKPLNAIVSTFSRFPANAKNSRREPCLLPPKNLKFWGKPWLNHTLDFASIGSTDKNK